MPDATLELPPSIWLPFDPQGTDETPQGSTAVPSARALDAPLVDHTERVFAASATRPRPTPDTLRIKLAERLGWNYGFQDRCGGTHHEHDCSGYQCWGMNEIGAWTPVCTTSFVMAQMCHDAGLRISYDDMMDGEPGWAFRGADEGRVDDGSRPNGASGHIVFVDMKKIGGTYEAMGRAYGIRVGSFNRTRRFTGFYRTIGLDYNAAPQPGDSDTTGEPMLFIDNKHPSGTPSRHRSASVLPDGNILLGNGAKLAGYEAKKFLGMRVVHPPTGGARYLGSCKYGDNGFLSQFLQKDGSFADFVFTFTA